MSSILLNVILLLAAQLCLTLFDPVNFVACQASAHGISPGENTGVGCSISFSRVSSQPRDGTGSPALQADSVSEPAGKP